MTAAPLAMQGGPTPDPSEDFGGTIAPFRPRRLDPVWAAALSRLCRRAPVLDLAVETLPLAIDPVPDPLVDAPGSFASAGSLALTWATAGGARAALILPGEVVGRILAALDPALTQIPPEPARSLLLELALAPLLERLEQRLGTTLTLVGADVPPAPRAGEPWALGFLGTLAGTPFRALLHVDREGLELLAERWTAGLRAQDPPELSRLPIPVAFCVGSLRLGLRALSALQAGDILVPDDFPLGRGQIAVRAGRRRRATARIEIDGLRLREAFNSEPSAVPEDLHAREAIRSTPPTSMEVSMMKDGGASGLDAAQADSALDDLDVDLVFELGRSQVDLATLRSIAPGYVFPLARDPSGPIDILANGRRIGRGEIVQVGETLGVQVTRLFGHD